MSGNISTASTTLSQVQHETMSVSNHSSYTPNICSVSGCTFSECSVAFSGKANNQNVYDPTNGLELAVEDIFSD